MDMAFLKNLFGGGAGAPMQLPGAPAPAPGKGSDIANLLSRVLGGAGAGLGAMQGQMPQQDPNLLARLNGMRRPAAPAPDQTVTGLLKRIFGQQNTVAPAQPPSNQIPTGTPPAGGTGGLY